MNTIQNISASDAYKKILEGAILIDVRESDEVSRLSCNIDSIIHIPIHKLEEGVKKLPKQKEYIMMCHSGGRSLVATQLMSIYGFESVYNMEGGITSWKNSGLPVV